MDNILFGSQDLVQVNQTNENLLNDNQLENIELSPEIWMRIMNYLPGNDIGLNNVLINKFLVDEKTYKAILDKFIQYLLSCPLDKILPTIKRFVKNKKNKQNADICLNYFNKASSLIEALNEDDIIKISAIVDYDHFGICENQRLNYRLYRAFGKKVDEKLPRNNNLKNCCCKKNIRLMEKNLYDEMLFLSPIALCFTVSIVLLILFHTRVLDLSSVGIFYRMGLSFSYIALATSFIFLAIERNRVVTVYRLIRYRNAIMIKKLFNEKYNNFFTV